MTKSFIIIFLLITNILLAQSSMLNNYFTQIRQEKSISIPQEILNSENAKTTLTELSVYRKDSTSQVRERALSIARTIGIQSKLASVRQQSIQLLISGIRDKSTGNSGAALTYLTEFKNSNFTSVHKDSVLAVFKSKSAPSPQLIRFVGFLELAELQNDLLALSQQRTAGKMERWSALLALARMDNETAVLDIMKRIEKLPVNDDLVYQLFPDLVYSRSRSVLNYLI